MTFKNVFLLGNWVNYNQYLHKYSFGGGKSIFFNGWPSPLPRGNSNIVQMHGRLLKIFFRDNFQFIQMNIYIYLGQKKLINSFSGTAASLKSSPHQLFLSIVFPEFSYPIIFGFLFYRNNNKRLSDSE